MTPPITESNLPADIDNRFLAKQLQRIEATGVETKTTVALIATGFSGLADRVSVLEVQVHSHEVVIAQLVAQPLAPKPTRAMRLIPFFRLAALVSLTLAGLAFVAGLIVFSSTRS